jgi:cell division protein FtsL
MRSRKELSRGFKILIFLATVIDLSLIVYFVWIRFVI